jgi:hypothetical protein
MEKETTQAEKIRLAEDARREKNWKRWGPYLSERQWGTVREDYSPLGEVWDYFPHDHARSRAYRWGEDGLLGLTDRQGRLAFAMALWNGRDSILKERLFGLSGPEGNHGEDVKELYYYLDSSPTHSYMKALYKYPHSEYPYRLLVEENLRRGKNEPEFELLDTDIFNDNRYFDVWIEYAKASPNDVLIRIKITNRSSGPADLHLLPTIWFRNTWSWGREGEAYWPKPRIRQIDKNLLQMDHASLNRFYFAVSADPDNEYPQFLFTENETNTHRLFNESNSSLYVKDAFHDYVIHARKEAVNPEKKGTKAAAVYHLNLAAQAEIDIRCRLFSEKERPENFFDKNFEKIFNQRIKETDDFYLAHTPQGCTEEEHRILRQAKAGLLWTKQFYHYSVKDWLEGDPTQPKPPEGHKYIRNQDWQHLYNRDVISMPDKWEYPWYAAWDLAFHMIPFANIDPHFTKEQLILFLREWYMHPNGQLPAYEFAFSDVNPPVHAWAAWRVYKMTAPQGKRDRLFLARVFQKLLLNFTWWVNRKDNHGHHIFSGGFLGLDNIGVFDRSKPLPIGGHLEQADGTAWMAFYCATMLSIALELAREDPAYEDTASKFFEHFIAIIRAINNLDGTGLWDEEDGFYYDHLHIDDRSIPLRIRSMVGLIPLIAVEIVESTVIKSLLGFKKRMNWFLNNLKELAQMTTCMVKQEGELGHRHRLLAIPSRQRLIRILHYLLDEDEFLSPFGIRSLSKAHRNNPFVFRVTGHEYRVEYVPGESNTSAFGGNSNWRGPIWFPVNYLLIEALERYNHFYGDSLRVECPTGSGRRMNLAEVAKEITGRLISIFLPDQTGRRPCHGDLSQYAEDPHWRQLLLFYEYFHGDNGSGVGASHQTGWTALIARWIEDIGKSRA